MAFFLRLLPPTAFTFLLIFLNSFFRLAFFSAVVTPRDHVTDGKVNKNTHYTSKPWGGGGHRNNIFCYNENENFVNISQTSNNVHGHGPYTGFHGI